MNLPRLVISAPKSGSGKTLITIGLIKALTMAGKKVSAFKCGPDYIDPLYHQKILGVPSRNLDLFFTDTETTKAIFGTGNNGDISIIEGVMGFFDGLSGISVEGSTCHVAQTLEAPVILVIDTKGMARSVLAEIAGFLEMDTFGSIRGVILNNMSSSLYESIKSEIEDRFEIEVLGYFPKQKDLQIESRYLGLKLPDEINDLKKKSEELAEQLTKTVDLQRIVSLAESADNLEFDSKKAFWRVENSGDKKVKVGIAKDEAFNFYYEDNLKLLEYYGAELIEFSPLNDKKLSEGLSGLVVGGGYPELFAEKLSNNTSFIESFRNEVQKGIPVLAECGGFMYLHNSIKTQDSKEYKMAGIINADCFYADKLVRFGYITVTEKDKNNIGTDKRGIRGHEFHYFDSTDNGVCAVAEKPVTGKNWECAHIRNNFWAGFAHFYYPSRPEFAENFVKACQEYKPCDDEKNYKFFQNTKCEYFPCHKNVAVEDFNCLFCYCPLYAKGEACGGNFTITKSGKKSCINCTFPHKKCNYDELIKKLTQ